GPPGAGGWAVPVLGTVAPTGRGVPELVDALDDHREWLRSSDELAQRERRAAATRINAIAKDLAIDRMYDPEYRDELEAALDEVVRRRIDPHAAAASLIDRVSIAKRAKETI